jgi:hypothetical protein
MIPLVLLWLAYAHGWLPLWVAVFLTVLKVLAILGALLKEWRDS